MCICNVWWSIKIIKKKKCCHHENGKYIKKSYLWEAVDSCVINKFQYRVVMLCWNTTIWLVKTSHMTCNKRSECFICWNLLITSAPEFKAEQVSSATTFWKFPKLKGFWIFAVYRGINSEKLWRWRVLYCWNDLQFWVCNWRCLKMWS